MNKVVLLLAVFAFTAFAQTCTQNKLAEAFDLDFEDDPVDGTDFDFCASLQEADASCCSADTVNGFQDMVDAQIETGSAQVASRDKSLLSLRNQALAASSSLDRLKSAVASLSTAEAAILESFGFSAVEDEFEAFTDDLQDNIDNFADFQAARSTCIKHLIAVQASAWCLACAVDSVTDVTVDTDGTIELAAASKTDIVDACFDYIDDSNTQNGAITIYYSAKLFSTLADFVEAFVGGTTPDADDIEELLADLVDAANPTADSADELAVQTPTNCDSDDCDWIFSNFIVNGKINWAVLARGGELVGTVDGDDEEEETTEDDEEEEETTEDDEEEEEEDDEEEEEEEEEEVTAVRRLATAWTVDTEDAGVSADAWVDNPGNVDASDTSASAFRTGVIASVLALFALLF